MKWWYSLNLEFGKDMKTFLGKRMLKLCCIFDGWLLEKENVVGKDVEFVYDAELTKQYEGHY